MAVLQHYYTSYVNKDSGSAGFQVKAMSSGIPPDTQATILRLISYRIPPTLDERALSTHPIALRYQYKNPHECIFLCSQSNGTDENGRPGNFFAHTLVMEPDFFTSMPPILYWRSQFWCTRDAGTNPTIAPLVSLEDIEPTLDVENVWRFLAQGQNIEVFHKLMSAVVHCQRTHRRIVIIDSADNVAMWIAAVSCMLPPDYRPMLSFATYHHDPYQSQFIITGTTSDSSFRASPDEYMSYFIYNAAAGKISDVEASVYADEVKEAANSFTTYETRLLTLFTDYMPLFPAPTQIDEQLDMMALYVGMLEPTHPAAFTPAEIEALTIALDALKRMDSLPTDEISKLHRLRKLLWDAYREVKDPAIHTVRGQIVTLLMQHKASTGIFMLEELQYFTNVLVGDGAPESVLPRLKTLRSSYGEDIFLATLNGDDYLEWLCKHAQRFNPQQLQRIWKYLGRDIVPSMESSELLFVSLQTLNTLRTGNQLGVLQTLIDQMGYAMAQNKRDWLQLAVDGSTRIPGEELEHFYYYFAAQLPLDQRVSYRTLVMAVRKHVLAFEIENDVRLAVRVKNGLAMVEQWADHVKRQSYSSETITYGLKLLRDFYNQQQRVVLAHQVLSSRHLSPLPAEAEGIFVQDIMSIISLSKFSAQNVDLYGKYQDQEFLSDEMRVVIKGILAMQNGSLDDETVRQLRQHFKNVTEDVYRVETKRFIADFCNTKTGVSRKQHLYMIKALFKWTYSEAFWRSYMEMLVSKLTNPLMTIQFVEILLFWFRVTPEELKPKYIVQDFFFRLPSVLEQAKNEQGSAKGLREFHIQAAKKEWYPSVRELLMERKGVLSTIGQSIIHMPKHFAGQGNDKEIQEREAQERETRERKYAARISALFERKKARAYHENLIPELYQNRDLFWSYYWGKFVKEVVVQDADLTLELLSFWFDEAYTELGQVPFVVQDFFLGLAQALEWAHKERGFRDNALRIHATAMKVKEESYPWYGLVQDFFSGAGVSKSGLFRRG